MTEFFEGSAWDSHAILQRQCDTLVQLDRESRRDAAWLARRDFALSVARDVLKEVLPPDSGLYSTIRKLATAMPVPNPEAVIDPYEVSLFKTAAEQIAWHAPSHRAGSAPAVESRYTDIERMLPQLVFRHWTFKLLIGLLVALVGVATAGVFKYNGITVNIDEQIQKKERSLDEQFDKQRQRIDGSLEDRKKESDALYAQLRVLGAKSGEVGAQLDQLQTMAQRSVAKFISEASNNIGSEAERAMPKVREAIDREYNNAVSAVKSAGDRRVAQVLALDGGASFTAKTQEFDKRASNAIMALDGLKDRTEKLQGQIDDLARAAKLVSPDGSKPRLTERLAVYFNEAVYVVYGFAVALALMLVINISLFVFWFKHC